MKILGIQWKFGMIIKIAATLFLIFATINFGHAAAEVDPETSISNTFVLNYTLYSKRIEFETDYENFTLYGATCEEIARTNTKPFECVNLEPCTNYYVKVNVRHLLTNLTFVHTKYLRTEYETPDTIINYIIPFYDSIYMSWNSSNHNCILEIKVRAIGEDNEIYEVTNTNDDVIFDNLKPCRLYRLFLTMKDINNVVVTNVSDGITTEFLEPGPAESVELVINEGTVSITWDPPKFPTCVDYYDFMWTFKECYIEDLEKCTLSHHNVSVTQPRKLTISNLEGCQNYSLKIDVNGNRVNSSSYHEFSTPTLEPGPVVGLAISSKSSINFTATWDRPELNNFCVEYYFVVISSEEERYITTETFFTFEDLMPCGVYNISVAAVSEGDITGSWTTTGVTLDYDSPSSVQNGHVTLNSTSLRVDWEPPAFGHLCVGFYRIAVWYTESPNTSDPHVDDNTTTLLHYNFTSLKSCTMYTTQIIAVTSSKEQQEGLPAQFQSTTLPETLKASNELEAKDIFSRSLSLMSRNTDTDNNCETFFARFICEASSDAYIKYAETVFEIHNTRTHFSGTVEPLSPFTQYLCKGTIYNTAGWSKQKSAIFVTEKDYPESPLQITANPVSANSFNVFWKQPRYSNGKLSMYKIHIQTVRAKYKIPPECSDIRFQDLTQTVEASKMDYIYLEALPYVEYSIQIAAVNEVGVGTFSEPVKVTTMPHKSVAITNFNVEGIYGPELSETYQANVSLIWPLPCRCNGIVTAFEGSFTGVRANFPDEYFTWSLPINSTTLYENDYFEWLQDKLQPEYNYTVTISVVVMDADISDESSLEFISPSGIPPKPNISNNGDVDVFAARNPTQSALVRFSTDILNSNMGQILFAALLISEKSCQTDPSAEYALIRSETEWPNVPTWGNVRNLECIKQYQTTPIRWELIPVQARDAPHKTIIEYIVGAEETCNDPKVYCNGPLKPGVSYAVVIRLFTSTGYSDTSCMYFRTDSQVKIHFVLLLIVSCLLIAFFLGFLYLWVTKKIVWHGEPFHGFEEHTGDISSKNFLEFYDEIAKSDKVHREFKELTAISNDLNLSNVASTSNETKNRYSNIFPYDKNRVILECDSEGSDYINASFINGYKRRKEYIATQGPKPESFIDFWKMILQYDVRVIVMVTQLKEGDTVKCHQYFPYLNKELHFGHNITISCKKETHYENYEKRELEVEHFGDCLSRTVIHYYFRKWPDHDCPTDVTHLIDFVRKVKSEKIPSRSPIAVHCSAGVGRTGTFIGLDMIKQRLRNENRINIYDTVKQLRFQRMKMVQTIQQYQFLYNCAHYLVQKKHSSRFKRIEQKKADVANGCTSNGFKHSSNGNGFIHSSNGNGIVHAESNM